ncbi:MAG: dctM3 [Alphaproteobacteria bacterium]|jgi:tripartite ATP-independent transporter DctM subunit|nr:dctM3 [Alphaproteobacteria bacterium]
MEWYFALALMLGAVCLLMLIGLPVAFSFIVANVIGAWIFMGGEAGVAAVMRGMLSGIANFGLAPIPLFIFMGEILLHTGIAFTAVDAIDRLISRVPGRLSIVSVIGGTIFAALSGSTIANTAMLGSVLLPEMNKRGYHPSMSMGPIMAVGGIAMLIPPSALAVLLASLAHMPVAELLVGGIIPGLIMSTLFIGYVVIRCWLDPSLAPSYEVERLPLWQRWKPFLIYVVPLSLIFVAVLGSIFAGIASPTDSAALGALMSVIIAACYRKLSWQALKTALIGTGKISVMILFIVAASTSFSQILAFSGATDGALEQLLKIEWTPLTATILMLAVLLVLGCFIDQVSMMLITLPFFMPLAAALDIDLIWLGVLMLIAIEMGLLTPPFGLLLFVMKGVTENVSLGTIYRAAIPFVGLEFLALGLLVAFPALVLWLPSLL